MKVLTDWKSGPPPCDGVWMVRHKMSVMSYGTMTEIFVDSWHRLWGRKFEWRGLAFNPQTAVTARYPGGEARIVIVEVAK